MGPLDDVRGVLVDIDGTLLVGDGPVPGAARFLDRLRSRRIAFRLTTNTTRKSVAAVAAALQAVGIGIEPGEVLAPSTLARRLILDSGHVRAALLVPPEACMDFEGVQPDEEAPNWVVVGDLGPGFTFERLNAAFRCLRQGASLIALQKNRYWYAGEAGWLLDAGPFVCALEYAAGVTAEVVGKPSRRFFDLALAELDLPACQVAVIGDDPETDGRGGTEAGCRTVLVRTGKYGEAAAQPGAHLPDHVVDSVAELG
jgi:HAD superfamily hydrolase (TIGR01458 family)